MALEVHKLSLACKALLAAGFVLVLVGCALMWSYSHKDDDKYVLSTVSKESLRYNTCYFLFIWVSSTVTALFQRPNLVAINAGLLAAIITFSVSLNQLDLVRILINTYSDLESNTDETVRKNLYNDIVSGLRQLAAGGILAYIGAGLSFIASVLAFRIKKEPQSLLHKVVIALIVLFGFIGCILIWQSRDVASAPANANTREQLFEATQSTISVVIIFVVGVFCGMGDLVNVAAALSAFYNFSILNTYLELSDKAVNAAGLAEDSIDRAGCVLLWLSAVFLVFFCALYHSTSYLSLDSDA